MRAARVPDPPGGARRAPRSRTEDRRCPRTSRRRAATGSLRAARRLRVALLIVGHELVQRILLLLRADDVEDRVVRFLLGLLRGLRDRVDLEDVIAELGLDRSDDLALGSVEDRGVERLLLLALGHAREPAALRLRGLIDRVLLRHLAP